MATPHGRSDDVGDYTPIVWTRYEDTPDDMRHEHDVDRLTLATAEVWAAHLARSSPLVWCTAVAA